MVAPKDGVELLGACRHGQLAAAQLAASLPVAACGSLRAWRRRHAPARPMHGPTARPLAPCSRSVWLERNGCCKGCARETPPLAGLSACLAAHRRRRRAATDRQVCFRAGSRAERPPSSVGGLPRPTGECAAQSCALRPPAASRRGRHVLRHGIRRRRRRAKAAGGVCGGVRQLSAISAFWGLAAIGRDVGDSQRLAGTIRLGPNGALCLASSGGRHCLSGATSSST
jgi:hypothetical protein